MQRWNRLIVLTVFAVLCACGIVMAQDMAQDEEMPAPMTEPAPLTVSAGVFCLGIEDHDPVQVAETFAPGVERVYLWTQVLTDNPPTGITHVWYHEDTQVAAVELEVNYPRTRTWSSKTIPAGATGQWRVDVTDPGGRVLESYTFTIQ